MCCVRCCRKLALISVSLLSKLTVIHRMLTRVAVFLLTITMLGCLNMEPATRAISVAPLTQQFESQKGRMVPVELYDSTIRNKDILLPPFSSPCMFNDTQIYYCEKSTNVRAVASGVVMKVVRVDRGFLVLVKSGDYLAVNKWLNTVVVEEGDLIEKGSILGKTPASKVFEFEIYRKSAEIDLTEWVKI